MLTSVKTKAQQLRGSRSGFANHIKDSWPKETPPKVVVDHGCGTAELTHELAKQFPEARVIGTDIKDHRPQARASDTEVDNFWLVKPNHLHEYIDNVDLLVVSGVAHHITKGGMVDFWDDCRSSLAPDGRLFVYEHAVSKQRIRSLAERALLGLAEYASNAQGEDMACAYNFMTPDTLQAGMADAGLEATRVWDVGRSFVTVPLLNHNIIVEAQAAY